MNIGVDWQRIIQEMLQLCDDTNYQIENEVYDIEEIAVRFSHRLVFMHPFSNGNGRCSRLIADLLVFTNGISRFTWVSNNLTEMSEIRKCYIKALQEADNHNIQPLLEFARS
jgi:Fic-DOC domain mobile mystery protein B